MVHILGRVKAGAQTTIQCGSVVEGEFTESFQRHDYLIDFAPGDVLQLSAETVGDFLRLDITVRTTR